VIVAASNQQGKKGPLNSPVQFPISSLNSWYRKTAIFSGKRVDERLSHESGERKLIEKFDAHDR